MLQLQRLWGSRFGGRSGPPETVVVFSDRAVSHAMLQLQRLWGSRFGGRSGPPETVVVFSDHVVSHAPTAEALGRSGPPENSRCLQRPRSFTCSNCRGGFGGSRLGGRSGPPETVVVFSDHVVSHAPTTEALLGQGVVCVRVLQKQSLSSATT